MIKVFPAEEGSAKVWMEDLIAILMSPAIPSLDALV